jgi:transcription elongation factor Elf1
MNEHELRRALQAKGAKLDCPSCGHSDWKIPPGALAVIKVTIIVEKTMDVGLMICSNCGFVRLHSLAALVGQEHVFPFD